MNPERPADRMTRAAFARHMGRHRSWVTRLAHAGRLVERDGLVDVAASLSAIEATAGLRDDVARRHGEARQGRKSGAQAATGAPDASAPRNPPDRPPAGPQDGGGGESDDGGDAGDSLTTADDRDQLARARLAKVLADSRRVQAAADREEMERDRLAGALIAREAVDLAMGFVGGTVRAELDVFADQVAPLVTPMSALEDVHAALTEAARNIQARVAEAIERRMADLVKGAA